MKFGDTFNRWTLIGHWRIGNKWFCRCQRGTEREVEVKSMVAGKSKSCGCLRNELSSRRLTSQKMKHGRCETSEWHSWSNMRRRCLDPNNHKYADYGGRGITVCDRWRDSFQSFFEDMGEKPSKTHTIDRINNDGNYEPGNCRWATPKEQSNNRRKARPRTGQHIPEPEAAR